MEPTTKHALALAAKTLAQSYDLVLHGTDTYIPVDIITGEKGPTNADSCIWLPLTRQDKRKMGNALSNILFTSDSELTNFDLMLKQYATENEDPVTRLLVKTEDGLRVLDETGQLIEPDGTFLPNFISPVLNEDPGDKAKVFEVISGWLNSDEEATSLLRHLSTALSPGWSAIKYILFIGDGRNGKSVLLSMLSDLFGHGNVSHVTRQQIAERLPVAAELNSKLLNIVYDGEMAYIKDSSMEKTLIAGEPGYVRMLYENGNTKVQTNALFLEALNSEPKTRDKSSALQKRLSRFFFPNVYPQDSKFERMMRGERMLGAFLALLLDHFVQEQDLAVALKQTEAATHLQVEQQLVNSPLLQYVQYLVQSDPVWIDKLEQPGPVVDPLVDSFMAWRINEGYNEYSSMDVKRMFKEFFYTSRKSVREGQRVLKKELLAGPKPETQALLDMLKGEADGLQQQTVVDD